MSQVTFTSKDLDTVLNDFEKTLRTPNRVNIDVISDTMRQAVAENFATESGDGAAWRPLAAETVEEREFLGFPARIRFCFVLAIYSNLSQILTTPTT